MVSETKGGKISEAEDRISLRLVSAEDLYLKHFYEFFLRVCEHNITVGAHQSAGGFQFWSGTTAPVTQLPSYCSRKRRFIVSD